MKPDTAGRTSRGAEIQEIQEQGAQLALGQRLAG